jgi:hypothetical protein
MFGGDGGCRRTVDMKSGDDHKENFLRRRNKVSPTLISNDGGEQFLFLFPSNDAQNLSSDNNLEITL